MVWWNTTVWDRLNRIDAKLDILATKLNTIIGQENKMAVDVSALTSEVTRNSSVTASVVQLVNNLAAQIAAIPPSSDPATQAALDALKTTLSSNDDAIAAAVVANTKS